MTHLCLVRHGQTNWNVGGRWQGHADTPLNSSGQEQARRLAIELADLPFDAIYSSDLQRAWATAQAVAAGRSLTVIRDPRLRELNMGAWEGKLVAEIPTLYPDSWADRQRDPVDSLPPDGESVRQLAERMVSAITDICELNPPDARVLIVSHGLALATFLCHIHGWPLDRSFTSIPSNATPVQVVWSPPKRELR